MPTITENHASPTAYNRDSSGVLTATRIYDIKGTQDPFVADVLGPQQGSFYGPYMQVTDRQIVNIASAHDPTEDDTGAMRLTVNYEGQIPNHALLLDDDIDITLDTSAQVQHVDKAISQIVVDENPIDRDPGLFIGVHDDQVDGVDIYFPHQSFSISTETPVLTSDMRQNLKSLSTKVNDRIWRGYDIGEVLYLGAVATKRRNERWNLTHHFLISENSPLKFGWEYLWFARKRTVDTLGDGTKKVTDVLKNTWVAKVYDLGNFMFIGLGT